MVKTVGRCGRVASAFALLALAAGVVLPSLSGAAPRVPPPGGLAALGPAWMIRIASEPLLFLVATDPKGLRFSGPGDHLGDAVVRPVEAASLGADLAPLVGQQIMAYSPDGSCRATVRRFLVVNRMDETWNNGSATTPIEEAAWRGDATGSAGLALAVEVTLDSVCPSPPDWARLARLPLPAVWTVAGADPKVRRAAARVVEAWLEQPSELPFGEKKAGARRLRAAWRAYLKEKLTVNLLSSPDGSRRLAVLEVSGHVDMTCIEWSVAVLAEVRPDGTLRRVAGLPGPVRAAADLDGDGWPELQLDVVTRAQRASDVLVSGDGGRYDQTTDLTVGVGCTE